MATKKAVNKKIYNNRFTPNLKKTKNFYKKQWTISSNDYKELKQKITTKRQQKIPIQDNINDDGDD